MPRIADLLEKWKKAGCDDKELTRRLIDLFFVSVLLDAGAGDHWNYVEPGTEKTYERSEGIAVASLYMFLEGDYSSEKNNVPLVDGTFYARNARTISDAYYRQGVGATDY